ncbi:hypothetical protein LEP1GSC037_2109 [Leptospira interrogans str. 2006001854]|uniref:7(1) septoil knot domain-containing protein n=1 Tax=Leptospira interrogans str. 2006001854 TaxID=1001590 RepID=M6G728_LEPIR|nr:hypothetical protein [Leptospira interrogans]EJP16949.1 hypothetical protein LEP1GSC080_2492 [Leptospira interrogans str. FPW2026]EMM80550.1 hypothetical protein LEP1GSC037_2109 [Leptospira interrogans str. 2006001854]
MKHIIFLILFLAAFINLNSKPIASSCTFNGVKLYGKVRVVNIGEDFRVTVVRNGEDLKVETGMINPDSCGRWQFVNIGEDFKIRYVDLDADFTIRLVTNGAGLP